MKLTIVRVIHNNKKILYFLVTPMIFFYHVSPLRKTIFDRKIANSQNDKTKQNCFSNIKRIHAGSFLHVAPFFFLLFWFFFK